MAKHFFSLYSDENDMCAEGLADVLYEKENCNCIDLYEKLLSKGYYDVLGSLAAVYWEYKVTLKDYESAMNYFRKAYELDNLTSVINFLEVATKTINVSLDIFNYLKEMNEFKKLTVSRYF